MQNKRIYYIHKRKILFFPYALSKTKPSVFASLDEGEGWRRCVKVKVKSLWAAIRQHVQCAGEQGRV